MIIGSTADIADPMVREMVLFAELADALDLREEADSDSPPWAAQQEIRRLEHEIVVRLHDEGRLSIG